MQDRRGWCVVSSGLGGAGSKARVSKVQEKACRALRHRDFLFSGQPQVAVESAGKRHPGRESSPDAIGSLSVAPECPRNKRDCRSYRLRKLIRLEWARWSPHCHPRFGTHHPTTHRIHQGESTEWLGRLRRMKGTKGNLCHCKSIRIGAFSILNLLRG